MLKSQEHRSTCSKPFGILYNFRKLSSALGCGHPTLDSLSSHGTMVFENRRRTIPSISVQTSSFMGIVILPDTNADIHSKNTRNPISCSSIRTNCLGLTLIKFYGNWLNWNIPITFCQRFHNFHADLAPEELYNCKRQSLGLILRERERERELLI